MNFCRQTHLVQEKNPIVWGVTNTIKLKFGTHSLPQSCPKMTYEFNISIKVIVFGIP